MCCFIIYKVEMLLTGIVLNMKSLNDNRELWYNVDSQKLVLVENQVPAIVRRFILLVQRNFFS